ncbi:MAG: SOS response-associated peptidase [Burkholderiales bacterium]
MCGRITQKTPPQQIALRFGVPDNNIRSPENFSPRYNIAPSLQIQAVRLMPNCERELLPLTWGLLPSWAKESKISFATSNARAETVAEKPAFRSAFKSRRCLIPVDGYYEWQATPNVKQPWYVSAKDGSPLALAGLWEHWQGEGKVIESCTIIVTSANSLMQSIHDRMPVIVPERNWAEWMSPQTKPDTVKLQLQPYEPDVMQAWPVSIQVNSTRNQGGAELISRLA